MKYPKQPQAYSRVHVFRFGGMSIIDRRHVNIKKKDYNHFWHILLLPTVRIKELMNWIAFEL